MSDIAIRVENLSKQYPSTGSGQALRQTQDKPDRRPEARYKATRESLTEGVTDPSAT